MRDHSANPIAYERQVNMKKVCAVLLFLLTVGVIGADNASAQCLQGFHCVKTGTCASIGTTCQTVAGVGISVSVVGSGGGVNTAFSYHTFGNPNLYVGEALNKTGAYTDVYNMACGETKYYFAVGCADYIGYQVNYVSTCDIIPGQ